MKVESDTSISTFPSIDASIRYPSCSISISCHVPGSALTSAEAGLRYGVSITDECVGWETTQRMLRSAHDILGSEAKKTAA